MWIGIAREKSTEKCYAIATACRIRIGEKACLLVKDITKMKRLWHRSQKLPSPGVPLLMRLSDGTLIEGTRPRYIANYKEKDLGYRDSHDNRVDPEEWSIR